MCSKNGFVYESTFKSGKENKAIDALSREEEDTKLGSDDAADTRMVAPKEKDLSNATITSGHIS